MIPLANEMSYQETVKATRINRIDRLKKNFFDWPLNKKFLWMFHGPGGRFFEKSPLAAKNKCQ